MNLSISRGIWEIIGIEMRVLLNFSESGWWGRILGVAQKTYIGIDGKKYCSHCNQSGFMGPKNEWKCRAPECQEKINVEAKESLKGKNETNIIENSLGKIFSNSNPIVWILSRSIGMSMLIIFFCFIGPYCSSGDTMNDIAQAKANARDLRENWVTAGACAFISSIFIFGLMRSGIVTTSSSRGLTNGNDVDKE